MIAVHGRAHVEQAIEQCRQTVGRPIVQACMGGSRAGGSGGGSPHMALAGIKEVGKLAVALSHVDQIILQLSSSATLT